MKTHDYIYDWNLKAQGRGPRPRVQLWDETLRDGLQSPSVTTPPIERKLAILRLMDRLGIQWADIGLPGAGAHHLADMDHLIGAIVAERMSIRPSCAVRTIRTDIEPIIDLQQRHGIPVLASAFLGTSPIRQYVEEWDLAHLTELMEGAIRFAVGHEIPVMFVTEDTTRSAPKDIGMLYGRAVELGACAVCVCDTVGHALPHGVRQLVSYVRKVVTGAATGGGGGGGRHAGAGGAGTGGEAGRGEVAIHWHGHQDRGLGLANTLAAIEAGADVVHGCALGIGERVGNTPMDQIVVNLKLMGLHAHDVSALAEYCRVVSEATGVPIPRNYPVVGTDAFETATGVHAAAVIKGLKKGDRWLADRIYSGVPASDFGLEQIIRVGPMSGKSNVIHWLGQRGIAADPAVVDAVLARAKDATHVLADDEIFAIARAQRPQH